MVSCEGGENASPSSKFQSLEMGRTVGSYTPPDCSATSRQSSRSSAVSGSISIHSLPASSLSRAISESSTRQEILFSRSVTACSAASEASCPPGPYTVCWTKEPMAKPVVSRRLAASLYRLHRSTRTSRITASTHASTSVSRFCWRRVSVRMK